MKVKYTMLDPKDVPVAVKFRVKRVKTTVVESQAIQFAATVVGSKVMRVTTVVVIFWAIRIEAAYFAYCLADLNNYLSSMR